MHTINGDGHRIEVIDVTHRSNGIKEVTFVDRSNFRVWTEVVAVSSVADCRDGAFAAPLAPPHHQRTSIPVEFPVAERQTLSCSNINAQVDAMDIVQVDHHFSRVYKLKNPRSTGEKDTVIQVAS